jgi:hypothetical protein
MLTLLYNFSMLHHIDAVCIANGGESMGDRHTSASQNVEQRNILDAIALYRFSLQLNFVVQVCQGNLPGNFCKGDRFPVIERKGDFSSCSKQRLMMQKYELLRI